MAFEILIRNRPEAYTTGNAEKDERGAWRTGYPVVMKDLPHQWGAKEQLPKFVKVRVTDSTVSDFDTWMATTYGAGLNFISGWDRKIDYEIIGSDLSLDGWRLKVFATNPGLTNKAGITQAMVESFITKWNGAVFSFAANEVIFDIAVFASVSPGAIQSEGFWGFNPSQIVFTENSYTQTGGIHVIEADYSAMAQVKPEQAERAVTEKGGTINSHGGSVVTFTITRSDVLDVFKSEVRRAAENTVFRKQFVITEALVNTIISEGGLREVTLATLQTYIQNRLNESI